MVERVYRGKISYLSRRALTTFNPKVLTPVERVYQMRKIETTRLIAYTLALTVCGSSDIRNRCIVLTPEPKGGAQCVSSARLICAGGSE